MTDEEPDTLPAWYLFLWIALFVYFVFVEWPPSPGFLFGWGGMFIGHVLWISRTTVSDDG